MHQPAHVSKIFFTVAFEYSHTAAPVLVSVEVTVVDAPLPFGVVVAVSAGLLTVPDSVTAVIAAPGLENEPLASEG